MVKLIPTFVLLPSIALGVLCCIYNLSLVSSTSSSQSLFVKEHEQQPSDHTTTSSTMGADGHVIGSNKNTIYLNSAMTPSRLLEVLKEGSSSRWVQLGNDIDGEKENDLFGRSVAASRDGFFIIVGAPFNDGINGISSGHARVYHYEDAQWVQVGGDIDGEDKLNYAGTSVDINDDGDIIIVGARENINDNGDNSGHARVYKYRDRQWVQLGQDLNGEGELDLFGWSVAISGVGDRVIVGGRDNDSNGVDSGHAQVYQYKTDNDRWIQMGDDIEGEEAADRAGWSVDINGEGNIIIVGAIGNKSAKGHARVYLYVNGLWVQLGQDLEGENELDLFGSNVAISRSGRRVIVGGAWHDSKSGYARVYEYNDVSWIQIGRDIKGEEEEDESGWDVDISDNGDIVIIGAHANDGNGDSSGHARIFKEVDGKWKQLGQDLDSEGEEDWFGSSVSVSGDGKKVAVGGPFNDGDNGSDSGHVRVFELVTCSDSPLKVLIDDKGKEHSARLCRHIKKRCKSNKLRAQLQTHCPSTCGSCEQYESSNSRGIFIFRGVERDCKWLRDSTLSQISKLCKNDDITATCRKTCSHFF